MVTDKDLNCTQERLVRRQPCETMRSLPQSASGPVFATKVPITRLLSCRDLSCQAPGVVSPGACGWEAGDIPLHVALITCWDSTQCIQLGHFIKIILSDRATGFGARETAGKADFL